MLLFAARSAMVEGALLAAVLLGLAAFTAWRQLRERATRDHHLSEDDQAHFAKKDVRRLLNAAVMALLAIGIVAGTWIEVRPGDRLAGRLFGGTWLGVALLLGVMLLLALLDWLANVAYARRHLRELADERRAFLRDELHRHLAARDEGPLN